MMADPEAFLNDLQAKRIVIDEIHRLDIEWLDDYWACEPNKLAIFVGVNYINNEHGSKE